MICVNLKAYQRACGGVTGGISDIMIFDPNDFNFTQATVGGVVGAYTALTTRAGANNATNPLMFAVSFLEKEGERTWKQSVKGCSVKYEHEVKLQLPQLSHSLTNFLQSLDAAGCCCGLGVIIRHNDGKIFVMGEKYVNATSIAKFTVKLDGADGTSGKLFDDFNGANVLLKSEYSRELYEYTGTWASLETFLVTNP
jgi:hypothetical protein